jgi:N-acyl-D-amino-acid deacylase
VRFDYILRGGLVIDGSGENSVPQRYDLGIKDDRIEAIGDLSASSDGKTIDITGLCVCPGFIDAHSHSDFTLFADGRAEAKVCQGITTEINGNCGMSAAPLYGPFLEQRKAELEELNILDRWATFPEYFTLLKKRGLAVNNITLVGHGNLRASVAGYSDKKITGEQREQIFSLLSHSVRSGAAGLSAGLIYPPGIFSDTQELIEIARETARAGGIIYTTHMRSEGDELLDAIRESVKVGFDSHLHVHISHLKTSNERNWGKLNNAVSLIQNARERGLRVTCDRYPYTASSTSLDSILPTWAYEGGREEELLKIKKMRNKLEKEILKDFPDDSYWEKVKISSLNLNKNKWMEGKSICEISLSLKKRPLDCLFDILVEERLNVDAIFFSMSEENLKTILNLPYTVIGSDSSARSFDGITAKGKPHPRGFGCFPRVLGKYVREGGVLSLSQAIYKMTGLTAHIFNIKKRGMLKPGFFADVTVFDPVRILDRATFHNPFLKPDGIHYVFVNGKPVMINGKTTNVMSGRILV